MSVGPGTGTGLTGIWQSGVWVEDEVWPVRSPAMSCGRSDVLGTSISGSVIGFSNTGMLRGGGPSMIFSKQGVSEVRCG